MMNLATQLVSRTLIAMTLLQLTACQTPANSLVAVDSGEPEIASLSVNRAQSPATTQQEIHTPLAVDNHRNYSASHLSSSELHALYETARQLVEKRTNTDLSSVQLQIATDDVIADEVEFETRRLVESQFSNPDFSEHFLGAVMANQAGTYAALYAGRQSRVMVSRPLLVSYHRSLPDDESTRNAAILALFIHELVHAADDQIYGIHENRTLNFRASFAQSAAFEGHAQWVTREICKHNGCLDGLEALDHFMFDQNTPPNQLAQPVQAVSRNVLEYSYIEGERFLGALAGRADGNRLITELLSNPPTDPIQILVPGSFPDAGREQRNQQLLSAVAQLDHPWRQEPWASVETSPLKGVNLRADPSRRQAAVDGFTQLITSMVAIQLYDQARVNWPPLEVTLLTAESAETAELFASSLHQGTLSIATEVSTSSAFLGASENRISMNMLWSSEAGLEDSIYTTLVAVTGSHVLQIAGLVEDRELMQAFAAGTLEKLMRASPT